MVEVIAVTDLLVSVHRCTDRMVNGIVYLAHGQDILGLNPRLDRDNLGLSSFTKKDNKCYFMLSSLMKLSRRLCFNFVRM